MVLGVYVVVVGVGGLYRVGVVCLCVVGGLVMGGV